MASLVGTDRQPRRGLTTQQKLKGVLLFLHSATIKLQLPTRSAFGAQLNIPLTSALQQVVSRSFKQDGELCFQTSGELWYRTRW